MPHGNRRAGPAQSLIRLAPFRLAVRYSRMAQDPAASKLLCFYASGTDHRGRTRLAILSHDDRWLEATHDYIQWLFPLPERSQFNPAGPVLSESDRNAFQIRAELRERLVEAWQRMLAFYGFEPAAGGASSLVVRRPDGARAWISRHNHNFLRISRILRCLALLGCGEQASSFLAALEGVAAGDAGDVFGPLTLAHWRAAAAGRLLR